MHIRPFERRDTDAVIALWQARGLTRPWNDPLKDIERKLAVQPELFLVGELDGQIVATAMGATPPSGTPPHLPQDRRSTEEPLSGYPPKIGIEPTRASS